MLQHSFVHLPGVGPETEQKLWSSGLKTWHELASNLGEVFGPLKATKIATALELSRQAFNEGRFEYFQSLLKGSEMWRLLPAMIEAGLDGQVAYLDIETTGLGFPPESHSTTIAVLFDGILYVEHEQRRKKQLLEAIEANAKLLVTFNGGPFDLPFLRREFNLQLKHPHVDLRFWLARMDYRGGLKMIQKAFPGVPQREYMDIDGFDAVRLWNLHKRGVPQALETLMTYNAEDTIVLEQLIYCGLNLEAQRRPHLELKTYNLPPAREIATRVCPKVYKLIRG